jgi:gamma-glutamylcyclotransferase (GGCT)/AIG2-like uncharacterized protein YtfP
MSHERVVVYGLLRRGGPMRQALAGARLIGRVVLEGFVLHDLGRYPGAVAGEGALVGELYELPHAGMLDVLDEREGVFLDPPLYDRVLVEADGKRAWLYVYARSVEGFARIPSGDWFDRG